jgi:two-component system NtrC family sensor kinase
LTFIIPNLEYIQAQMKKFFKDLRKQAAAEEFASILDEFDQDINVALKSSVSGSHRIREIVVSLNKLTGQGFNTVMDTQIGHHLTGIVELFFSQNEAVAFITEFKDSAAVQIHILEFNQCLIGILNNAVQAIQDAENAQLIGKNEGRVFISTEDIADKQVRIIIRDNGIGIDPKVISHIFEPFFTTRTVGMGKGLGLSEAYAVIRKLKGHIEVQSELRKGTSVIITLPVVESSRT